MERINTIAAAAIMMCSALLSCTKEANEPADLTNNSQELIKSVTSSEWFSASWQQNGEVKEYVKQASQLQSDILKEGKVLVFGRGGFEMRIPTPLPSSFDANYIAVATEVGGITLTLQGSGAISTGLQFRYILIPVNKLTPGNLNYDDYDGVCDYYHLEK